MVKAANGVSLSAMKIFSITLRYFRDHAIQELRDATGTKIGHVSEQRLYHAIAIRILYTGGHQMGDNCAGHLEAGG